MLVGLIAMVGLMLCVVPGVIFMLWFMLVIPVVVLEKTGAIDSIGRSRELMRGNLTKGFVIGLVVVVLASLVSMGVGFALGVIPGLPVFFRELISTTLQALVLPISTAPGLLFYYDIRIRKEAFDLQMLSRHMMTSP